MIAGQLQGDASFHHHGAKLSGLKAIEFCATVKDPGPHNCRSSGGIGSSGSLSWIPSMQSIDETALRKLRASEIKGLKRVSRVVLWLQACARGLCLIRNALEPEMK